MERQDDGLVNFEQRRLLSLWRKIAFHRGEIAEAEAEVQRIQMGQKPHDLNPPKDRFLLHQIDFNQTRAEQANEQSDAKEMKIVPYEHLIQ